MISIIFYFIIIALAFPSGIVLAKLCKDEIKNWRKRLLLMSVISLIIAIIVYYFNFEILEYKIPIIVGLFFIIINCIVIVWRSYPRLKKN